MHEYEAEDKEDKESASHPSLLCREAAGCLIRSGSLEPRARFLTFRGLNVSFLKNRLVNISDGLYLTCGDSRTCFRCLTGVLVNFHDMQKIMIFFMIFRASVTCHVSSCDLVPL